MSNYIIADTPAKFDRVMKTLLNRIVYAVCNAIPLAAKEIAELVHAFQIAELKSSIGSQNRTGRPNTRMHRKIADSLFVIQVHYGQKKTHYDIVSRAPHTMWVEEGSDAPAGIPWSNVSGVNARDYSRSSFKGYQALSKGLQQVTKSGVANVITAKHIREKLLRMRP